MYFTGGDRPGCMDDKHSDCNGGEDACDPNISMHVCTVWIPEAPWWPCDWLGVSEHSAPTFLRVLNASPLQYTWFSIKDVSVWARRILRLGNIWNIKEELETPDEPAANAVENCSRLCQAKRAKAMRWPDFTALSDSPNNLHLYLFDCCVSFYPAVYAR